jgi:hypothetical protein
MPHVSNEEIRAFGNAIDACIEHVASGGVRVDATGIRTAVRERRAAAERYIELLCLAAATNPSVVQSAVWIATAYQVEFSDAAPLQKVLETAKATGGETWLRRMGTPARPGDYVPLEERPERKAAKDWWRSNKKQDAICDKCNRRIQRGEGFVIEGRKMMLGDRLLDMGKDLFCENCFRELE